MGKHCRLQINNKQKLHIGQELKSREKVYCGRIRRTDAKPLTFGLVLASAYLRCRGRRRDRGWCWRAWWRGPGTAGTAAGPPSSGPRPWSRGPAAATRGRPPSRRRQGRGPGRRHPRCRCPWRPSWGDTLLGSAPRSGHDHGQQCDEQAIRRKICKWRRFMRILIVNLRCLILVDKISS